MDVLFPSCKEEEEEVGSSAARGNSLGEKGREEDIKQRGSVSGVQIHGIPLLS